MKIGKRLQEERKKAEFSSQEMLGNALNVSFTTIARWEKDQSPIPSDKLLAMGELGLDVVYILTGKPATSPVFQIAESLDNKELENIHNQKPATVAGFEDYAMIPLYDVEVSAGGGAVLDDENIVTYLAFTLHSLRAQGLQPDMLACVRTRGDSMSPTIEPRDTVMIDMRSTTADGGIFVLRHESTIYIKRLMREKGGVRVISDNQIYPEWMLADDDDYEIIGKKVWSARWD